MIRPVTVAVPGMAAWLAGKERLSLPAVDLDDGGLATNGIGIHGRATERLSPVSGESLNTVGVEAVAERMGEYVVGHHPAVPGVGKTAQAVDATRRLEDSSHIAMMTILLYRCKRGGFPREVRGTANPSTARRDRSAPPDFLSNHISDAVESCEVGNPGTLGMTKERATLP